MFPREPVPLRGPGIGLGWRWRSSVGGWLRELGMATWRRESSGDTLDHLPVPEGLQHSWRGILDESLECQDRREWLPTGRGDF